MEGNYLVRAENCSGCAFLNSQRLLGEDLYFRAQYPKRKKKGEEA